jgi:hypothetical protein
MDQQACEHCGGKLRFDRELGRRVCGRCGRDASAPTPGESGVVRGVEIVDWLDGRAVSRYYVAVEATPPKTPNRVYLRAVRRSWAARR